MIEAWLEANQGSWLRRAPGVAACLAAVGSVHWPVVVDIDDEFGGLSVYLGERELWVGLDSALEMPSFRRVLDGRPHVLIGAFTPNGWYVDEAGSLLEVDAIGQVLARAKSVREALEGLALQLTE